MKGEPEPTERLQRLLHLKRHEQPPPGYFDDLAAGIRARLAEDRRPAETDSSAWWHRWRTRPFFPLAYAALALGLVVMVAQQSESNPQRGNPGPIAQPAGWPPSSPLPDNQGLAGTVPSNPPNRGLASTSAPPAFLFEPPGRARTENVNFQK